jgi:hypothetical protein
MSLAYRHSVLPEDKKIRTAPFPPIVRTTMRSDNVVYDTSDNEKDEERIVLLTDPSQFYAWKHTHISSGTSGN